MTPPSFLAHPRVPLLRDFSLAVLAVLAVFAAVTVHGYESSFYRQIIALFLLLTLVMTKLFVSYKQISLPTHPAFLCFLVFIAWIALSITWSPVPGESFLMTSTFSCGLFAMLLSFWANHRQWRFFHTLLIPLALLVVAATSFQAFVMKIDRPAGFLMNWNTNSAFIGAILLPYCAVHLRQITQRRKASWLLGLFLAICAFGMSLGQGRGSLFALVIGLAVLLVAYRTEPRAYWGIALTLAWVVGGYALGDLLHGGMLSERLSTMGTSEGLTDVHNLGSGREYLWSAGWHMYLDRPWLGWGIGVFHYLYPRYRSPLHVEDGHYAHNDYLQFLLELGPVGLLLFLCWVAALLWLAWRLFRSTQAAGRRFTDLGLALACLAMLLHTGVDFHLYQSSMQLLLGAYAGRLIWSYSQQAIAPNAVDTTYPPPIGGKLGGNTVELSRHTGNPCRNDEQKTVPAALRERMEMGYISIPLREKFTATGYFSILTAICLFLGLGLFNLETGFLAVRDVQMRNPPLTVFQQCGKTERIIPFIEAFQTCHGWLIHSLVKNQPDKPVEERDKLIRFAVKSLDHAIQNNPVSSLNHKLMAELLMILPDARPDLIIQHLRQSLALNPYQLDIRLDLADTLEKTGDAVQEKQVLADGLGKAYVANVKQVRAYWEKIDGVIDGSAAFAAQKQAVRQQLQRMDNVKAASPETDYAFNLPDIGWRP